MSFSVRTITTDKVSGDARHGGRPPGIGPCYQRTQLPGAPDRAPRTRRVQTPVRVPAGAGVGPQPAERVSPHPMNRRADPGRTRDRPDLGLGGSPFLRGPHQSPAARSQLRPDPSAPTDPAGRRLHRRRHVAQESRRSIRGAPRLRLRSHCGCVGRRPVVVGGVCDRPRGGGSLPPPVLQLCAGEVCGAGRIPAVLWWWAQSIRFSEPGSPPRDWPPSPRPLR